MLFTLGKSNLSIQQAINKALSRSLIFDQNVSPEQAKADWRKTAVKCRAICGSMSGTKLKTGQVQGDRGGRHYVAVAGYVTPNLPSPLSSGISDISDENMGLEVDWRKSSTIFPNSTVMPKYGDGGYGIPGNTLMVYSDRAGTLQAHLTGNYANEFYSATSNNPGGKYQTWTYRRSYSYCISHALRISDDVASYSQTRAPGSSSSISTVASNIAGPFVSFLRPAYSTASWGVYSTGIGFGNSAQQMYTNDVLNVTKSPYQDFPISMPASGAPDEIVNPTWAAMVTTLADRRVLVKFDVAEGADIEPVSMSPGQSYELSVNTDNTAYIAPRFINL